MDELEAMKRGDRIVLGVGLGAVGAAVLIHGYETTPYDADFAAVAAARGVSIHLLKALARQESGMRASAVGQVNANGTRDYGLLQLNEKTARALGVEPEAILRDAHLAIDTGARLILALERELGALSDLPHVIAAYNAGSPAIKARGVFNVGYVSAVLWHLLLYRTAAFVRGGA